MLLKEGSPEIHRGDRIAILGPNGCRKTTLRRALAQEEHTPGADSALDHGRAVWAKGAARIHSNGISENLDVDGSVTHAVNTTGMAQPASRKKASAFLDLLRFPEADLNQKTGTLSGGQRARVALADGLPSSANVIPLDEPTNHRDLSSTHVMKRTLANLTVVAVSHDRFFTDRVAICLPALEGKAKVHGFEGNWSLYAAQGAA